LKTKVVILGAGGHGHVIADIIRASGDILVGFLDDDLSKSTLGKISDCFKYSDAYFIIGIGNNALRKKLSALPVKWYTAIHPSAVISPSAKIREGTCVMPNAVINCDTIIGKQCIINSGAIVEHNNTIGDFTHISVGVKLGGTVTIGNSTLLGIGCTVCNNISICSDCIIGAGSVVVDDITENGKYFGIPAKKH